MPKTMFTMQKTRTFVKVFCRGQWDSWPRPQPRRRLPPDLHKGLAPKFIDGYIAPIKIV